MFAKRYLEPLLKNGATPARRASKWQAAHKLCLRVSQFGICSRVVVALLSSPGRAENKTDRPGTARFRIQFISVLLGLTRTVLDLIIV